MVRRPDPVVGVTCWRSLAENVTASLQTGDKVVVTGRLATRPWKGEDGVERQGLEVEATAVGLELSRGTATLARTGSGATTRPTDDAGARADPVTGEVFEGEEAAAAGDSDAVAGLPGSGVGHAARPLAA